MKNILDFIHLMEGEKNTLRHSWTSAGRQESIAEHSWRLSIMAIVLCPYLKVKVDLEKVLRMIIIHDMAEIVTGDIPAQVHQNDAKIKINREKNEIDAIDSITKTLDIELGTELCNLWTEHEDKMTPEAKFVKALDKIEVRIQHNEADLNTWDKDEYPRSLFAADKYCLFDETMKKFNELVKEESIEKLKEAKIDISRIEVEAEILKKKQL